MNEKDVHITFVPSFTSCRPLVLFLTIYVPVDKSLEEIYETYVEAYKDEQFVRVLPLGQVADLKFVKASNYCDISLHMDERDHTLIVVSTIDNMVKGSAGQAVQNMNIMYGLDENTGLNLVAPSSKEDVMKDILGGVCAPIGFSANGIHAGMRKNKSKKDLSLIVSEELCTAAATYTQNKVKGAPLTVTKQHLKNGRARAIICNSGNANTCNSNGIELANEVCALTAKELGLKEDDIIVASTGVIGQPMSIDPFKDHMKELVKGLNVDGSHDACYGIMTTDTQPKEYAVEFKLGNTKCHIGAIAKGSGMIHPNMATMLAFVTSDVAISKECLEAMVHEVVDDTFNMVSVDGDTSTNDMLCVLSNGMAQNNKIVLKGSVL
mgnify:CR=1 FL=1